MNRCSQEVARRPSRGLDKLPGLLKGLGSNSLGSRHEKPGSEIHHRANPQFETAELGQPTQPSDAGVAGVDLFFQVVDHPVAVIGAHWNLDILAALLMASLLLVDQTLHHISHAHAPLEVSMSMRSEEHTSELQSRRQLVC